MWSTLLEENGIAVVPVDGRRVTLRRGSQRATYTVATSSARVHPSDVTEPPAGNAAEARGWPVTTLAGQHLHTIVAPEQVAAAIDALFRRLGIDPKS